MSLGVYVAVLAALVAEVGDVPLYGEVGFHGRTIFDGGSGKGGFLAEASAQAICPEFRTRGRGLCFRRPEPGLSRRRRAQGPWFRMTKRESRLPSSLSSCFRMIARNSDISILPRRVEEKKKALFCNWGDWGRQTCVL